MPIPTLITELSTTAASNSPSGSDSPSSLDDIQRVHGAFIAQLRDNPTANATTVTPVAKGGTGATDAATARTNLGLAIGTNVQAYNAANAVTDTAQSFTASQRGTPTTDNDLSFDLNATNNFSCTPTAGGTLTFTNIASAAGQSGLIKLVNGSDYAIAAAATTKVGTTTLATISATGTYLLTYFCDSTNVYVVASGSLA